MQDVPILRQWEPAASPQFELAAGLLYNGDHLPGIDIQQDRGHGLPGQVPYLSAQTHPVHTCDMPTGVSHSGSDEP